MISILQSSAYLSKSDRAGPAGGDRRLRGNFFSGFGFSTHLAHTHSLPALYFVWGQSYPSHLTHISRQKTTVRRGRERKGREEEGRVACSGARRHAIADFATSARRLACISSGAAAPTSRCHARSSHGSSSSRAICKQRLAILYSSLYRPAGGGHTVSVSRHYPDGCVCGIAS